MSQIDMREIINEIVSFDHTYEYSDDSRVWRAGNQEEKQILAKTSQLTQEQKTALYEFCKNWFNITYSDHPKFMDWDNVVKERYDLFYPVVYKMTVLCGIYA